MIIATIAALLGLSDVPADAAAAPTSSFSIAGVAPLVAVGGGHVFDYSGDPGETTLRVYNLTGQLVATVPNEPGVVALDVSADGGKLFASLGTAQQVSVIDTATMTETARYSTSSIGTPGHVVAVGGVLFVSGWSDVGFGLAAIDTTSGSPAAVKLAVYGATVTSFTARATDQPGIDDLYVSWCESSGACELDLYSYDGVSATFVRAAAASDAGILVYDAADHVLLTTTSPSGITVRDPDSLAASWTITGELQSNTGFADGHVVEGGSDPATGANMLTVRNLTGTITYQDTPSPSGNALNAIAVAGSGDAYGVQRNVDGTYRFVTFAFALLTPTAPNAPATLTARAIAGGRVRLTWTPSVVNGNNAPTRYDLYRSQIESVPRDLIGSVPADIASFVDTSATAGESYTYFVAAVDANGEGNAESTPIWVVPDATAPSVRLNSPTAAFTLTKSVAIRYSAADSGSGVASYDVRYRTAAWNGSLGRWIEPAAWQHRTTTSASLGVSPGRDYCISVRARDKAGNVSTWSAPRCTAAPLDDRSLARLTPGWQQRSTTDTYQNTITRTRTAGAQLRLTGANTDRIAIVATTCAACGAVAIYLDGHYWRSISTHAVSTDTRAVITVGSFSLHRTTITLRTKAGKPVMIDGLGVSPS